MNWLPTDEQVIAKLRGRLRYRRLIGSVAVAGGLILAAVVAGVAKHFYDQQMELIADLTSFVSPTTRQSEQMVDTVKFSSGFSLGMLLTTTWTGACSIFVSGAVWLFPNRRDQLLLKCWDEAAQARK